MRKLVEERTRHCVELIGQNAWDKYSLKTTPINRGEKFECVILPTANAPKSGASRGYIQSRLPTVQGTEKPEPLKPPEL